MNTTKTINIFSVHFVDSFYIYALNKTKNNDINSKFK